MVMTVSLQVSAEDTLKNVNVSPDGIITWDPYPGTDYYNFEILHEAIVTSYMLDTVSADLEVLFDQANTEYSGVLVSGMYQFKITAIHDGNPVAATIQSYAYHYTPPAPLEASISSECILTWKAYPGAASYDYGAGDQMAGHEGTTLQADLKDFIDRMISLGKLSNTGTQSVSLIARDFNGSELARWEGSCSYKASHSISDAVVEAIMDSYEYTGKAITPKPVVTYHKNQLIEGTDYTLTYMNNISPGTATITITGKGIYSGTKTKTFRIAASGNEGIPSSVQDTPDDQTSSPNLEVAADLKDISKLTVKVSDQVYSGKGQKPVPVFKSGKKKLALTAGTDYTIFYKNNKKIGTAALTVIGKGAYTGRKTIAFQILPKGTRLKKLAAGETQITVTWKKQKKQITGYRIQYSLNKNFKKAKTVTVKKAGTGKKKLKNLKSGKRYYVRICTYKKIGKKTYCSDWSKGLRIKTKKAGE